MTTTLATTRVFNFSAGPATMPDAVLQRAQEELLNWRNTKMSVMEISHRSALFFQLIEEIEANFRALLAVPNDYKILFLPGGATIHFSAIPMNLLRGNTTADYLVTGHWSNKASRLAAAYCEVNEVANGELAGYVDIPDRHAWQLNPRAAYFHYADNETISGIEFSEPPNTGNVPIVADMSSNILSRPIDVKRFGMIYASAQKNLGPAGLSVVIIHESLLNQALPATPAVLNYQFQAEQGSMVNTPPTYSWYLVGLVLEWIKSAGGLQAIADLNQRKAEKLYSAIDGTDFYVNHVDKTCRSRMNVPFYLTVPALQELFLQESEAAGLTHLKGHALVGGLRASIYNAMPEKGVDALIHFMKDFETRHG